ncbi:MAG: spiro-SPASM protein, partial [Spirochaetia bacterium]|nr:spiro-SPASM protein [Spirochaetia bacterium]
MKNSVFINCINASEYILKPLPSGSSSFRYVLNYALQLPDAGEIYILCLESEKEKYKKNAAEAASLLPLHDGKPKNKISILGRDSWDSSSLFETFLSAAESCSHLFYIYGDCPFLDIEAGKRMYDNHLAYSAQYSFSDGAPYGLTPEIIALEIADALKVLSDKDKVEIDRDTIFTIIQRDINSFDIETDISEIDLRMLRISLTADSKRNFLMLERFEKEGVTGEKRINNLTPLDQKMIRTLPAYYPVQITDRCYQSCSYCPYPKMNPDLLKGSSYMDFDKYCMILEKISSFSEDAVISLSLWGEPSSHPRIEEIIIKTLENKNFKLVIETSGIGWKSGVIESLAGKKELFKDRLIWILSLDTDDRDVYRQLRGEGYDEALSFSSLLDIHFPKNTYIQAVRMEENEKPLEKFYKSWKQ